MFRLTVQAYICCHTCQKWSGVSFDSYSIDLHVVAPCSSYKEWKDEKEHGSTAGHSPDTAAAAGSNTSGSGVGDVVRGLGQEAGDTARSAKDVVKMEGQAAGEGHPTH